MTKAVEKIPRGPGRPEEYTIEQVLEALKETMGQPTLAAELLGCVYNTVRRYIDKSPECQELIAHYRERRCDKAELALEAAIHNKEPWAVRLVLTTVGKDRGYVPRTEVGITASDLEEYSNRLRNALAEIGVDDEQIQLLEKTMSGNE